jgi:hypothetical protein
MVFERRSEDARCVMTGRSMGSSRGATEYNPHHAQKVARAHYEGQVMHEPDLDSIFEPVRLALETARSGVKTRYSRDLNEKEKIIRTVLKTRAAIEKRLSRKRKKAQPLEATINAAVTRTIRQNVKEFPDLPSARLESEGRKVIDRHLQRLRGSLERHMKVEIASQTTKRTGLS